MDTENIKTKRVNEGANVQKIRQVMGIKQSTLADTLGVNQQLVSRIEHRREIGDDELLARIADVLKVSPQLIKEMEENSMSIVIENNTFATGSSNITNHNMNMEDYNNTVHPVDQLLELNKEITALCERLIAIERERTNLLEELLKEKK